MEHKYLPLEWKASPEGKIEGYGAVFGNPDLGGDIILPGAFSASLQSGRKIKMLMNHAHEDVVGVWNEVSEDQNGLRVKGDVLLTIQDGKDAFELVKAGAIDGLSIGYRTVEAEYNGSGNRVLKQLELWEVSLVTFPMNEMARIDAVKAQNLTERDLERMLTRDAGLSRTTAQRLLAGGFNAIKAMRDAGDGADEVAALLKARLSL